MATGPPKQKVSLSLDVDLVAAFEQDGPLSTQVNATLRAEWRRRRHAVALDELLTSLDELHGPLDTPEDEKTIQRYVDLLS